MECAEDHEAGFKAYGAFFDLALIVHIFLSCFVSIKGL